MHSTKGDFDFHGVTLVHERGFLIFVELPTPRKGIFDFCGVTLLHKREFLSFVELIPLHNEI